MELNWNSFFVVSWLNVHNVWTDTQRTIEDQELRKEVFLQVKCFGKGLNRRDLLFEFDARLEEGISKFQEQGINGAKKNGLFVPLSFDIPGEEQLVGSVSTLSLMEELECFSFGLQAGVLSLLLESEPTK